MMGKRMRTIAIVTALASALGSSAMSAQAKDKYTLKVPGGLAFSEFKGYEAWQVISLSQSGDIFAAILGNPTMIEAYQGHPRQRQALPRRRQDGQDPLDREKERDVPQSNDGAGAQHDVDFMVKDSKRFATVGGWGYGAFK